jgi:hypothetical protein
VSKNEKSGKHDCPKIDKELWNLKVTGPAYTPGMSTEKARAAWQAYLRLVARAAKPMPRKTF